MGPFLGASFHVEIEGIGGASFCRCSGLGARVEVLSIAEGGAASPRLLPGDTVWEPLVLERGWVQDARLWDWFRSRELRDGSVQLLTPEGSVAGTFGFRRAWPSRWSGPTFDAGRSEIALERLEIVHEGLEWKS